MIGVAAHHRVVLERAEVACEGNVLGASDVLIAEEQHAMLDQQGPDLGHECGVARCGTEAHVGQFGSNRASQGFDPDAGFERARGDHGGCTGAGRRVAWGCHGRFLGIIAALV